VATTASDALAVLSVAGSSVAKNTYNNSISHSLSINLDKATISRFSGQSGLLIDIIKNLGAVNCSN
jgi:hypothetical protein